MESRAYESGRSECRGVTPRIGAETGSTRKRCLTGSARREPTSGRCSIARESGRTLQPGKQRASDKGGAPVSLAAEWNSIDWREPKHEVKRLQMRIAKAVEEGRWGRVKALQHILTHSFHAKALAVRRVTSNNRLLKQRLGRQHHDGLGECLSRVKGKLSSTVLRGAGLRKEPWPTRVQVTD